MTRAAVGLVLSVVAMDLHGQGIARSGTFPPDVLAPTIAVKGLNGTAATLTAIDLSRLPQHNLRTLDHEKPVEFEGVLLADVLSKVDLPTGDKFHGTAASFYLLVGAKDGYKAVFAWAELDAGFMDKPVYVVTKRDGEPLPEKDGPFELVAPGEKRAGRWVRHVTSLEIRQAG